MISFKEFRLVKDHMERARKLGEQCGQGDPSITQCLSYLHWETANKDQLHGLSAGARKVKAHAVWGEICGHKLAVGGRV